MQSSDYAERAPKFIQLVLQQDLLGGWSLLSESGQQGRRGRTKQEHYETHDQAMEALLNLRDKHIQKGFRVVFLKGEASE
jgi:predicted DNA-binding WGR domain protein